MSYCGYFRRSVEWTMRFDWRATIHTTGEIIRKVVVVVGGDDGMSGGDC